MLYPTEYRAPNPANAVPILGTVRQEQPAEEEVNPTPDPYPVAYSVARKY